ncbi:ankyrin repeat-containing domain protein [Trichophaea hybrida]|nr:ankyrin repeat-containing domain protein [Trichophaea hybrida]
MVSWRSRYWENRHHVRSLVVDKLIEAAKNEDIGIAYIYCDYADQKDQTTEMIIASFAKQLSVIKPSICGQIQKLYKACNDGKIQPDLFRLTETLRNLCMGFKQVFFVLDALDECVDTVRKSLLDQLERVDHSTARLFLTSRPHLLDMDERYGKYPQIPITAKNQDIRQFLQIKIEEDARLSRLIKNKQSFKDEVIDTITSNAMDMFLLAELQFNSISQWTTVNKMKKALTELPVGLNESFEKTLARIKQQFSDQGELALEVLRWISHAKRPLSIDELRQALAIQPNETCFDEDDMPDQGTIVHVCMGLVIIDQQSSIIRLVHYSLQEYFQKFTDAFFCKGEAAIAMTCLTILSFEEFNKGYCSNDKRFEARLQQFPLLNYAAHNWGHHARDEKEETTREIARRFLQNRSKVLAAIQVMLNSKYKYSGYSQEFRRGFTGIHVASFFGLVNAINNLLMGGARPDRPDSAGRAPLTYSAGNGHLKAVERLLAANADVNAAASIYGPTALQAAAGGGHLEIVERLLAANADVNAANKGRTALQAAAGGGHLEIVERLLAANADVNAVNKEGRTALQAAAGGGHLEIVERLLAANADVNAAAAGYKGRTALQAAAGGGHLEIVERLLAANADVNAAAADYEGRTALQAAAGGGHLEIVERLLAANADVNAVNKEGRTALQAAAGGGHLEIVERLLAANADVNAAAADYEGRTALQAAAGGGHLEIVERLLAANADVNAAASIYGPTALQAAAGGGHLEIVERLLAANADVNAAASIYGPTALQAAAGGGHLEIVERLLAANADVNAVNKEGLTALQAAAGGGHLEIVERLLAANADVNAVNKEGLTALQAAAGGGHLEIVERLLAANADVNAAASIYGPTALQAAAGGGHLEIVERLLAANADVNAANKEGRTALQAAAEGGHLEIVERLLAANADVNAAAAGYKGRTALQAAAGGGHLEIVERLLAVNADVNAAASTYGRTALQAAAEGGHLEIMEILKNARDGRPPGRKRKTPPSDNDPTTPKRRP